MSPSRNDGFWPREPEYGVIYEGFWFPEREFGAIYEGFWLPA